MATLLKAGVNEDDVVEILERQEADESTEIKEPSRKRLNSIKSVCKRLLFSKDAGDSIQKSDIVDCWKDEEDLAEKEVEVVLTVVNNLRPYLSMRCKREKPIIADGMNFVVLANQILTTVGYSNFAREVSPLAGPSEIHTLHLDAKAIYEMFGGVGAPFFLFDTEDQPITTVPDANHNKRAIFNAFFDIGEIEKTCDSHGLILTIEYRSPPLMLPGSKGASKTACVR